MRIISLLIATVLLAGCAQGKWSNKDLTSWTLSFDSIEASPTFGASDVLLAQPSALRD